MLDLVWPATRYLSGSVDALRRGWSPDNRRPERASEDLARIETDPAGFLAQQVDRHGKGLPIALPDGSTVPRLPGFVLWLWDGEFCGSIGFRRQPGTTELPSYRGAQVSYPPGVTMLPDYLRERLAQPLPGVTAQLRMAPNPRRWPELGAVLKPAAALLLIYPHAGEWHVPLTVRGSTLRDHTGQVSLPGGRLDRPDESVQEAALREAHEEIGVAPAHVEILGRLTPVPIAVSGYLLHPVVGAATGRPDFAPAAEEVERLIELPVLRLLEPDAVAWEERVRTQTPRGFQNVPYFDIAGARIWGATAMILAEFTALLDRFDWC